MTYLCIGEPLVEFTTQPDAPDSFTRRAGGDTLNTAIYLSRLIGGGQVGYMSCLGDDPHSRWLRAAIADEGIDLTHLAEQAGGRPGLSFITTDHDGERSFSYWRDQSPFRGHFDDPARTVDLGHVDTIFLSGVALAVLHPEGRANLLRALAGLRERGAQVVFDTNYRPALWPDADTARRAMTQAAGIASLLLPSLDDIDGCFGIADPHAAMAFLMTLTPAEIVLTTGGGPVLHRAQHTAASDSHALPLAVAALDTTGAGDSFNAAWMAARGNGASVADSV
ncbi:MAG: sugar kinase, partial [Paracoccus sp. (in: a-proteobacteria)]|nr:sugar kinase [Paracoccus sp. (in: a-proteobacteria)]